ncbi:MAG: 50S ribosomal protein L29 [Candidatus Omnitrophica bacterium]|nr:50S ribosomal protein L29 [Candidatus Omnitrophota bacterium]MBU4589397.1 50S ribosomal protein L29 [Candidatus Omnitrophota bacterium]
MLKPAELRNLSKQELVEKLVALKKSLFEILSQRATGRVEKPSKIKQARRDVARIMTVLQEKEK